MNKNKNYISWYNEQRWKKFNLVNMSILTYLLHDTLYISYQAVRHTNWRDERTVVLLGGAERRTWVGPPTRCRLSASVSAIDRISFLADSLVAAVYLQFSLSLPVNQ